VRACVCVCVCACVCFGGVYFYGVCILKYLEVISKGKCTHTHRERETSTAT